MYRLVEESIVRRLTENLDPFQIELLKGLKKTFDPKNILNPGKIFDFQE